MITVVLVIHILLAISIVGIVLIQRSEGGGLGIGGGGGGGGVFMTGRAGSNLLTKSTAVLAALFFMTSMGLAWLATGTTRPASILDTGRPMAPIEQQAPAEPAVPLGR
ncbi:MAG: preprotein translocase subunit SecG [Alphaproteobacteria bacterium]